jgi:hypothetical protein
VQALTIAIGPLGIGYFGQTLLATDLTATLARLEPPDHAIGPLKFTNSGAGWSDECTDIHIDLSNGGFGNFKPAYEGLVQQAGGRFQVALSAADFVVSYRWNERWHDTFCTYTEYGSNCMDRDKSAGPFNYPPHFARLAVQLVLAFTYDRATNAYDVTVAGATASPSGVMPNVPAGSVIQNEDQHCFSSQVSDATARTVADIDFKTPVAALFGSLFKTIPASGHLTPDIVYDFAVGDSPLTFPGDRGLAVGVTGTVKYKGERYAGKPPSLPVPPVPTDANHLRAYVSSYEFDALNWAFFKAGLLTYTLEPHDIPDPDLLHVKHWADKIAALKPYSWCGMKAHVTPNKPSTTSFQIVWELSAEVMAALKEKLPASVYQKLGGIDGDNYVSKEDLDEDLKDAGVTDPSHVSIIERTAQTMGMVVTHDLEFNLTIENGDATPPNIVFNLSRTDVLQNLSLGVSGAAQTLKFDFKRVTATAKLVSTTVPKFDKLDFGGWIWQSVGEPAYDQELIKIGHGTGVPLPIMQGFHFLFDQAQLSIQDGYVSVLAQVHFTQ